MRFPPSIDNLIMALRCLPGVGPKSAQRMALYLLERQREQAAHLAKGIIEAIDKVTHCQRCHNLTETPVCDLCLSPKRNAEQLCIVESPMDVIAIEQTHSYSGLYYVLLGHLSPLDGIGPQELKLDKLLQRIQDDAITEVILATNPTVEGEATAHYIAELLRPHQIKTTRIAHGVPVGGELEFIDGHTISRALLARETMAD